MASVLFNVWLSIQGIIQNTTCRVRFRIQGIIQNTTCSVWFIIQGIIQKWPGYYSAYSSVIRVLFKIRPAASGSGFSVLLKKIQRKYPGYYSASGSLFRVLFKLRPAASGSGFWVLYKIRPAASLFRVFFQKGQGIIQSMVQYSGYYLKYDLQRLVQDSAYF